MAVVVEPVKENKKGISCEESLYIECLRCTVELKASCHAFTKNILP